MTNLAFDLTENVADQARPTDGSDDLLTITRLPRITVDAYCGTPMVCDSLQEAFGDRRMSRVRGTVRTGNAGTATAHYRQAATPHLLIIEARCDRATLLPRLAELAEVCDSGTKVVVIGHANDVSLYRDLMDRGVADYLVAPVTVGAFIATVARLYSAPEGGKLGRTCAFIGAKGGVGSSTIAQNVAWTIASRMEIDVLLADMDLPFGSAGLNFNLETGHGMAEAIGGTARLDDLLLERLVAKRGDRLGLLAAPGLTTGSPELAADAFERLLEVAQATVPLVVLDLPHLWTPWVEKTLHGADEIIVTATADLPSLRNAKALFDAVGTTRLNDSPPRLVLNQTSMGKREEIKPQEFADALETTLAACIKSDPKSFSRAANKGQTVGEATPAAAACRAFEELAQALAGRPVAKRRSAAARLFATLMGHG